MDKTGLEIVLYIILSLVVVLLLVVVSWFALWKAVLSKNPLIREFFELDKPAEKPKQS